MAQPAPNADARLAEQIVTWAARLLTTLRDSGLLSGKPLGDAGDKVSNAFIVGALQAARPDDGILSEEGARDNGRLGKQRVWIVDPLDGTREYSEGRADYAVHVALAVDGVATAGAVALPGQGVVFCSAAPPPLPASAPERILVSRTRAPDLAAQIAWELGADLMPMGSAGAKTMAVLRGEAQAYIHSGGQYEWDSAAPVAVAQAAGLHASRLDGRPLRYNQKDPYLPDLVVARPDYAPRLMQALARLALS